MTTGSDTNILFDILFDSPEHGEASIQALHAALSMGPVVICPIVYTELAVQFPEVDGLHAFLQQLGIRLVGFETTALLAAARAWQQYTTNRGPRLLPDVLPYPQALRDDGPVIVIVTGRPLPRDLHRRGVRPNGTRKSRSDGPLSFRHNARIRLSPFL